MTAPAKKPATTPIPVQLSEGQFTEFILPHLSMPRRGPRCKLGYHRLFNLILWVLYTGMQWKCLPFAKRGTSTKRVKFQFMRSPNCELDDYDVLRDIDVE